MNMKEAKMIYVIMGIDIHQQHKHKYPLLLNNFLAVIMILLTEKLGKKKF